MHIVNQNRLSQLGCLSRDSLADLDPAALGKFRRISHLKAEPQFLGFFVEQKNRKNLVVDDFADDLGDPAHGRIQVERRGQHVRHVEQQRLDRQAIRFGKDRTHRSYDSSRVPGSL